MSVTATPPAGAPAESEIDEEPARSPAPMRVPPPCTVSDDALTVTVRVAVVADTWPGALAVSVVVPPSSGSSAMPPAATVLGELLAPAAIVTVRDCALPALVTSCATAALPLLTVTVIALPPGR
ncbi:MAG: hypothetical protein ACXW61_17845, partial [Gemmatirosa sp.]